MAGEGTLMKWTIKVEGHSSYNVWKIKMRTILKRDRLWDIIVCPEEVALEVDLSAPNAIVLPSIQERRDKSKRLGSSFYCKRQCDTLHRGIRKSGTSMENINWWTCTSHVTTPKYYYSPASYTRWRWMEVGRNSSTLWGQLKKFSTNSRVWEKLYLRSKWCMFFLLWAPHSDHLVSRLTTNFWQSYREAHARRKLGGKEEVKLKMRHSWYFGNHIRHQGRIYVVMATTTRSNRPRKTTMESRPTTRWACSKRNPQQLHATTRPEHWVRDCQAISLKETTNQGPFNDRN